MGIMVKALAISLRSENSTFAPSGWFMHAWSHIISDGEQQILENSKSYDTRYFTLTLVTSKVN